MSDSMPSNAVWQYDYIDHYRLDEDIIDGYLRGKWGNYKYHVKLSGDKYRFWVPRKLKKVCSFPSSRSIGLAHMNQGGAGRIDQKTKTEDVSVAACNIASSAKAMRLVVLRGSTQVPRLAFAFQRMLTNVTDNIRLATDYAIAPYISEAAQLRLDEHAGRLFVKEHEAALDLLDLEDDAEDFILSFGERHFADDFYSPGFRQRTYLASTEHRPESSSGITKSKGFQICYSLKSVEPSDTDGWSIRQCAIHHTFDLTAVGMTWAVVKGDDLMKRRIESATGDGGSFQTVDFHSVERAFDTSLRTHLLFCDWSTEHWRWYVNSLEEKFQDMTGRALSAPINAEQFRMRSRTNTQMTAISKQSMFDRIRTPKSHQETIPSISTLQPSSPRTWTNPETGYVQPQPPPDDEDDDADDDDVQKKPLGSNPNNPDDETHDFSFGKLRKVHAIAGKANEALLVLKQNIVVLSQLKDYYSMIPQRKKFPRDLANSCRDGIDDFEFRVQGVINDMHVQILRLETMLNLIEDRKTLLHSILNYQNTQANKRSTHSMVTMTEDMNEIARKTKIETVSMKVITLVTLFFLPGTFISVGRIFLSTLMSTDVFEVDYKGRSQENPYAQLSPWQIYLALSLPLTAVTLLVWAMFHFWEMRREKPKMAQNRDIEYGSVQG
ncbi:MAG: hypothetical protein Q9208_006680 [Pyrenodesmia sp. 3 TL-2023]